MRYAKSKCADAKGSLEMTSNRDCIDWPFARGYASTRWSEASLCTKCATRNHRLLDFIATQHAASGKHVVPLDWTVIAASA